MKQLLSITIPISILAVASLVLAHSSGPLDKRTGAPGDDGTCQGCHGNFPLDSGSGNLSIVAPATHDIDDTIDMSISLSQFTQERWGFEITAIDSTGNGVGEFLVTDPTRTQLSNNVNGRQYVKQTLVGTDAGVMGVAPGWSFKWVAPSTDVGPVTFYAAGNASDNDFSFFGDYIYSTSHTITYAPVVEPVRFAFVLNEAQANNCAGTGSEARGYGLCILNSDSTELSVYIVHDVVSLIGAHIHNGAPCFSGGIAFSLIPATSPIQTTWALSPSDVTDLINGDLYVNIHSSSHSGGEIRGQIVQGDIRFVYNLEERDANAGGGTGSFGSGFAVSTLSADATQLSFDIRHDVAGVTGGGVYQGAVGVSGPGVFSFSDATSPVSEIWNVDTTDIKLLFQSDLYVESYSTAYPTGAIRGQLVREASRFVFSVTSDEANGGGGTGSTASGFAVCELNADLDILTIHIEHDVLGATTADIQLGGIGVEGPVVFSLGSATSPIVAVWNLTAADVDDLLAGDLYLNIRSGSFANGEIRGQIDQAPIEVVVPLDESQVNNCMGSGSLSSGVTTATLKAEGMAMTFYTTHDVANVTAAHIHIGDTCEPGSIVKVFPMPFSPVSGIWYVDADTASIYMRGQMFSILHSVPFPSGEIRGQLVDLQSGCCLERGNVNASGSIDISDLTFLVAYQFKGGPAPPCLEQGNINGAGAIDISDLTYLVAYQFKGGPAPPPCN